MLPAVDTADLDDPDLSATDAPAPTDSAPTEPLDIQLMREVAARARPTRRRSLREWVEQEIRLTTGPHAGRRFRTTRQPIAGLILDALDDRRYNRSALSGPVQSGKSLLGFVAPILYHICELREDVVVGVPDLDMSGDKWRRDILPVLLATRYRDIVPRVGAGSRNAGRIVSIEFTNGAALRFMSAGGGDKSRAGYTARVACLTEVDGYDEAGGGSDETDKVSQIEARTEAHGPDRRVYMECTVSTSDGRIWREIQSGTASRIYCQCPHCSQPVYPEREHLVGWQDAPDVVTARTASGIACPACGVIWSEPDRYEACRRAVLVHCGQEAVLGDDGALVVIGEAELTDTLGISYSAAHNVLVPISETAAAEWKAANEAADKNLAERGLRQYKWTLPMESGPVDVLKLDPQQLSRTRARGLERGHVPRDTTALCVGVDVGKHLLHWTCVALRSHDAPYVVDYGRVEVASDSMPEERAIAHALASLQSRCQAGWMLDSGSMMVPGAVWCDEGYQADIVHAACASDASGVWFPAKGLGWHQAKTGKAKGRYKAPSKKDRRVVMIGEGWYLVRLPRPRGLRAVHVDADHWKSWLHGRLSLAPTANGAATIYQTLSPSDHIPFLRHVTAERRVSSVKAGVGAVQSWENPTGRNNHWLDSTCLGVAACHYVLSVAAKGTAADGAAKDWFAERRKKRAGRVTA